MATAITGNRAAWLNQMADEFLVTRRLPWCWDYEGVTSLGVELRDDRQLHFSAVFDHAATIVCTRPALPDMTTLAELLAATNSR